MSKIVTTPFVSKNIYTFSLFNYSLQANEFFFSNFPKFEKVTFSIVIPKGKSSQYNIIRSLYLLYVITGCKPYFTKNKRGTSITVIVDISGKRVFSFMTFFYFLSNSEKFRVISSSSFSHSAVDFSFHDPSSIFDFRDCRFDYHNFPFKVRVSFVFSKLFKVGKASSVDLLLHDMHFPRFF